MPISAKRAALTRERYDMKDVLKSEVFLRSINIVYDAQYPERIGHFQPTGKTIPLLRALGGFEEERAFLVVAPYGSGKSITASYLLQLIENRPDSLSTLKAVEKRLAQSGPELARLAARRRRNQEKHGIVLAMQGHCHPLGESIKSAALASMKRIRLGRQARGMERVPCRNIEQVVKFLAMLRERALDAKCDRILILWDEFGRHLESLLSEGQPAALNEIQLLAEFASRSKELPMTLGLLMHQQLVKYAGNMPESVKVEWKKIEGRFDTIQYIDDSKEIYRLIGEVVSSRRQTSDPMPLTISPTAAKTRKLGLFPDFSDQELEDLLSRAYPLEPVALYLLPRLSARVAQNERTMFNFLYKSNLDEPVGPDTLYDYFSPSMQSDTAVGGTYRQWLETQSALLKVGDNDSETKALKAACLLGLGTSGERTRAGRDLLLLALAGHQSTNGIGQVIDKLIQDKLLLHRRHSDEVSIWHGTDVDIRGKLEEEKNRSRQDFQLLEFLSKEVPPPTWRPSEYNDQFGIRRYLMGEYHTIDTLASRFRDLFDLPARTVQDVGSDGKIFYVVASTLDDLKSAQEIVRKQLSHDRIVVALAHRPLDLLEAGLELFCLLQMEHNRDLVDSDPLVQPELHQMADDARSYLQQLVDQLVRPGRNGPRWFYQGKAMKVENAADLRRALSTNMHKVFHLTPKINNEMIVRNKPSAIVVNARKKLVLAILERSGQKDLGIEGNFPDASMFRTVLLHTGLYRPAKDERWGYAPPDKSIVDPGLRSVWGAIKEFITVPSDKPKSFQELFRVLREPPFGVRLGLLPILLATGLKAFPSAISLTRRGVYVTDILPSDIEDICRQPEMYQLVVPNLDKTRRSYLSDFLECFTPETNSHGPPESDLIRACFDALEEWKTQLPSAALTTRQVSARTARFRRAITTEADPVKLLFDAIPEACGLPLTSRDKLRDSILKCKSHLSEVAAAYGLQAATSVRKVLRVGPTSGAESLQAIAASWANCFEDSFADEIMDEIARGLLSRSRMRYSSDEAFLESLSSLLAGKPLGRWDDTTASMFDREIRNVARRIEETALSLEPTMWQKKVAKSGIARLATERIAVLFEKLTKFVGHKKAREILLSLMDDTNTGKRSGHHTRGKSKSRR